MSLLIREARVDDWESLYKLNLQLGFEFQRDKAKDKLESVLAREDNKLFVAEYNKEVLGYIHAGVSDRIYDDDLVFVYTVIVDKDHRGKRFGHELLSKMEQWAGENKYSAIGLWSRLDRVEAHKFYESHGYENERTQKYFLKFL
ncbi:MAG: GNAT family N-acetyltransferase [Clostridiaceae bacterium]